MTNLKSLTFIVILCSSKAFAQQASSDQQMLEQFRLLSRIFVKADSIKSLQQPGLLDSAVFRFADSLDHMHPAGYYQKSAELLKEEKFNEAAFLFYLGRLRFSFYNAANPKYQAGADGALSASLAYTIGEPVNIYLRCDANNFIALLKKSQHWYATHDYTFFPKKNGPEKFTDLENGIQSLINKIEQESFSLMQQWQEEISQMRQNIDKTILELEQQVQKGKKQR